MRTLGWCLVFMGAVFAEEDRRECRSPHGWWSLQVPTAWELRERPEQRFKESVVLSDPGLTGFVFTLQVDESPLSLDSVAAVVHEESIQRGVFVQNVKDMALNGRAAKSYEYAVETPKGALRIRQVLVAAGDRRAILGAGFLGPVPEGAWERIDGVLSSFELETMETAHVEWEERDFEHLGLSLDLPQPDGKPKDHPTSAEIAWKDMGLEFGAACERWSGSLESLLDFNFLGQESSPGVKRYRILWKKEHTLASGEGILARMYSVYHRSNVIETSVLCFRVSDEEAWMLVVSKDGHSPGPGVEPFEKAFVAARVSKRMYSPPASALPPLTESVEVWGGAATLRLPVGWRASEQENVRVVGEGPKIEASGTWGADGALDLGLVVESGSMEGGQTAYEKWLHPDGPNDRDNPRAVEVGGRSGALWRFEWGPPDDRWVTQRVVAFDGDRYYSLEHRYPAKVDPVYGPLAEQVAATVKWK